MSRIPTAVALRRGGIDAGDGLCPLCRSEVETADHLLTSCITACVLWQKVSKWCWIPPIFAFSTRDLLEIHKNGSLKDKEREALHGIIVVACWCLWLARNKVKFSDVEVKVDNVFSDVKSLGLLWFKNRCKNNPISWAD
ncbi:uncharacterized protein LOC110893218 [Helianthus annuus]|uniref:uncharacterized protein LOC110893218 n=1 Tax=Helianthus annuus TaxID=4232 RepID=UPI000B8FE79C|nr:uncharacterized protein LOC110893218 [Helianthus annuus]